MAGTVHGVYVRWTDKALQALPTHPLEGLEWQRVKRLTEVAAIDESLAVGKTSVTIR